MSRFRWQALLGLAALFAVVPAGWSQQFTPHLGYVYPAGGRQGTTVQVTVGGQYLAGTAGALFSGRGIQATMGEYTRPLTPMEATNLREKVQELLKQPRDAVVLKQIADIRKKLATFVRRPNPVLAETVTLKIVIAPDAEPGTYDLRLKATNGLSNPIVFQVSSLPEVCLKEPGNQRLPLPGEKPRKAEPGQPKAPFVQPAMVIPLPAVINGQIMPGDVDRYRFQARAGQSLIAAACARELIPYLADAVPGWFQAALTLYDADGQELAFADHYRFHPDPVLFCQIPKDGEYVLEIRDAIYRGREDFIYRITLGELPFVTSVFPLGQQAGTSATFQLQGWNLPRVRMTLDLRNQENTTSGLKQVPQTFGINRVPLQVDALPECLEQEPNNEPASAQRVTLPIIVNGRIDRPEDWDVFRFEGRAGQPIVAEVQARSLDSPLDSVLKLTDAAGKQLAFNDDHETKGAGLSTHHADSLLTATLPADGTYYLYLGDAQHKGGSDYAYRLRISEPRPDFELRVVPSSITVRPVLPVPITVYALRKDGFSQEIALSLKGAPAGCVLSGARIPANQDQVRITLTAPSIPPDEPFPLHLEGRALIQGRPVVVSAVPAEDMMQAFAYHHLVPAQDLMGTVIGRGRVRAPQINLGDNPVKLPAGGAASVRFTMARGPQVDRFQFALSEPPEGIAIKNVSPTLQGVTLQLSADAGKVKPGLQGNLIVEVFTEQAPAAKAKPNMNRRRVRVGTLPAIPFEIVGK